MTDPDIVKRLQADAIFFGTRQEPLLVDDAICREMAECWEIAADEIEQLRAAHAEMQRMVCRALYTDELMQRNHAKVCGWRCFEATP